MCKCTNHIRWLLNLCVNTRIKFLYPKPCGSCEDGTRIGVQNTSWWIFSAAEIGPIETCFSGGVAYICDFQRQQAIQRWAIAGKNGLDQSEQEFFQSAMTGIGSASTETQYNDLLSKLRQSALYKRKENARSYVETTWTPCYSSFAGVVHSENRKHQWTSWTRIKEWNLWTGYLSTTTYPHLSTNPST